MSEMEKNIMIVYGEKRFSYKDFWERVHRLINGLESLGFKRGDRQKKGEPIGIMLYNSNEFVEALYACNLMRSPAVLINWHLISSELEYVITNSDAKVLIVGEEFLDRIAQIKSKLEKVKHFIVVGKEAPPGMLLYEELLKSSSPERVGRFYPTWSIMLYTSGTTGLPKGIDWGIVFDLLSGRAIKSREEEELSAGMWETIARWLSLEETTNIHLVAGPLYHAAPLLFANNTITLGGRLVLMRKFNPVEALKLIEREKVSTTFMAPVLIKRILDVPDKEKYDVSSLKVLICAAAPCPVELKRKAIEFFGPVFYEFYGSTEASINTVLRPEHYLKDPSKLASVGKIAPGNKIKILTEDGKECPPGQPGELHVMSILTRYLEYYKDPEKTEKSFRIIDGEKYFIEGEIAYLDNEGFLYIVDRKKDVIISGGVNIYPAEIENIIHSHPKVEDVAVIGVPDPNWGESVKALVVLKKGEDATEEEIIKYCRERMAGYKCPKSIEFVDSLPRHEDGKIMKRLLREKYWKGKKITEWY